MRSLLYICLCLLLLSCATDAERKRMTQVVERADRQNKAYDSITHVDSIAMAVEFFDRHGSANEQVRAHYLLGCAYRDMGEAPMALQYYQEAADHADTTREDCDYRQLSVVYAQMADLFYEQLLPYDMLEALSNQYQCSMKCNDTLHAIQAQKFRASAYELLGNSDSVINIRKRGFEAFKKHGFHQMAAQSLGPVISTLLEKGLYEEARQAIHIYETESGFFEDGEIIKGKELFYYEKGLYYLAINQLDSAEHSFRKLLRIGHGEDIEGAYKGLYLLYQKKGNRDSVSKYTELCYQLSNHYFQIAATEKMRHIQGLYNYNRNQKIAQIQEERANRNFILLMIFVFLALLILVIGVSTFLFYRQRKRNELSLLRSQYEHDLEDLEQAKYDAIRLKDLQQEEIVSEKNAYIKELQLHIEQYQQKMNIIPQEELETKLAETNIYTRMKYLTNHPQTKVTKEEWEELRLMVIQQLPQFHAIVNAPQNNLKQEEYDICILVRLFFAPSEIAILTNQSIQYVSMKRSRMLQKIFHQKGKSVDFDKLIREIH